MIFFFRGGKIGEIPFYGLPNVPDCSRKKTITHRLDALGGVPAADDLRHLLPFIAVNETQAEYERGSPVWNRVNKRLYASL